ncbi:tyrosine-protein phosphatase [Streptomyces albipurpureus]|uniref:Tyrosine-protein phosphatase n=1 Tax=Streptomyces albipurpureus TaxID=2897419 RepID=A0ABT0UN35_9ACTN|nr:tyrosine-protein phosphatase [Streptomyces sp. CWNU-1]MCM2389495.1 tyrosine-protein phosphatase [Streptomyces sp. CWNU-1]
MRRHVAFDQLRNFRDLGGYYTADGHTVRWGRLYRSDSLGKLQGRDLARFQELGIQTVIDLRYPWEIAGKGRIPHIDGLTYLNLSIEHRPYDQAEIDPTLDPWRYLADRYAEVATDGAGELRQALETIASGQHPLVFHCASGKDRTGLLAGLVLALLEVSEEQIIEDFALTELATEQLITDWKAAHPERALNWPGYGRAPAEIMRLFLADLNAEYGSVRAYATDRLGVDDTLIDALRGQLLD